jgi:hypothetical protein
MLNARDQSCILYITLSNHELQDIVFWSKETSSLYRVQSAYKILQSQKGVWHPHDRDSL